jgi:hypothetical protein
MATAAVTLPMRDLKKSEEVDALTSSWARLRRLGLSDEQISHALDPIVRTIKLLA